MKILKATVGYALAIIGLLGWIAAVGLWMYWWKF